MHENRVFINTTASSNGGSNFSTSYYWSSTELGSNNAWAQFFSYGGKVNYSKGIASPVRAVRVF